MEEKSKTISIALHLRRVTYEDTYVAVPATDVIMKRNEDGTASIDYDAFVAEAIRLANSEGVDWKIEESHSEPHPVQGPTPEGRRLFDGYHLLSQSTDVDNKPE